MVLDEGGTAFDPIAGVDIGQALDLAMRGVVDMPADHAIGMVPARLGGEAGLELADIVDRVLDLELGPGRERPMRQVQPAAHLVDDGVAGERGRVGPVAHQREPFGVAHDEVEQIAMDHEQALAVGGLVDDLVDQRDAAELQAGEVPQEIVVIAGDVDQLRALAHLAQQLLDDVVMRLREIPAALQPPAIDDVADQIDLRRVIGAQEFQHEIGLCAARAEMQIGDEDAANLLRLVIVAHARLPVPLRCCRRLADLRCALMTEPAIRALARFRGN